jgi:hypothetical protein
MNECTIYYMRVGDRFASNIRVYFFIFDSNLSAALHSRFRASSRPSFLTYSRMMHHQLNISLTSHKHHSSSLRPLSFFSREVYSSGGAAALSINLMKVKRHLRRERDAEKAIYWAIN